MERRTFMALVSGGLLAAPLVAEAQLAAKVARVGFLAPPQRHLDAFREVLREAGLVEGVEAPSEGCL